MQTDLTRRKFVHGVAGVSAALATRGRILGANDRINTAVIGLGTRGSYLFSMALHRAGEKNDVAVVALCDVYQARLSRASKKAPDAKQYTHHQELFDRKDIDAVFIATPDHWHAPITLLAHEPPAKTCMCEKPMTHTGEEASGGGGSAYTKRNA